MGNAGGCIPKAIGSPRTDRGTRSRPCGPARAQVLRSPPRSHVASVILINEAPTFELVSAVLPDGFGGPAPGTNRIGRESDALQTRVPGWMPSMLLHRCSPPARTVGSPRRSEASGRAGLRAARVAEREREDPGRIARGLRAPWGGGSLGRRGDVAPPATDRRGYALSIRTCPKRSANARQNGYARSRSSLAAVRASLQPPEFRARGALGGRTCRGRTRRTRRRTRA